MKKTFKIGEYVVGGIIEVIVNEPKITINFRNMHSGSKEIVDTKDFISSTSVLNEIEWYIEDNGTYYYAEKVVKWIRDNIELPQASGPFGW